MAPRTLAGVGLQGFAAYKEGNWHNWADSNWRIISALLQGRVKSATSALPGSPANGDMYIVPAGGHQNEIAIYDVNAWIYIVPKQGWRMYAIDGQRDYCFDGATWSRIKLGWFEGLSLKPPATSIPNDNGEVTFELSNDTTLTIRVKGSDGTARSATIVLS